MCFFITATLPKDVSHQLLDALARNSGRQFQPLASPAIAAQLPSNLAYFLTTAGHCDCGTVLGSARRAAARSPDWGAEEAKLLRKGWSRTKVARVIDQRKTNNALKQKAAEQARRAKPDNLEGFVSSILQSGLTTELGLLLHSYRGPLDEEFNILRHEQVAPSAHLAEILPALEEDVLYVFRSVM